MWATASASTDAHLLLHALDSLDYPRRLHDQPLHALDSGDGERWHSHFVYQL